MPTVPTYSDFLKATKVAKFTGVEEILNDAALNTYLFAELLRGKGPEEILQAGQSIKDTIQLSEAGTFEFYNPNPEFNPTDDDVLTDISESWRFAKTHYGYSDEIIALNQGTSADVFVNLKKSKEQAAKVDMWNGSERALCAVPVAATMESGTGDNPPFYSLSACINEGTNGLWPGFTTLMGVNATNEDRWRCRQVSYDSTNISSEDNGILAAMDDIFLQVKFEAPEDSSQYWENDRLRAMKILTNKDGYKKYKRLLRAGNDRFVSPQDPAYNNPTYSGIPVKYIATFDTAALEIVANVATGAAWPAGKPRFMFANFQYIVPIFHTKGYMEQVGPVPGGINQPFSHAVYFRNWMNLFFRSRLRQGIVYPQ